MGCVAAGVLFKGTDGSGEEELLETVAFGLGEVSIIALLF